MQLSLISERLRPWMLLVPALILIVLVFVLPIVNTFVMSFYGYSRSRGITGDISIGNYVDFFRDPFNIEILIKTVRLSAIATLLCAVIGFPIATQFARSHGRRRAVIAIIVLLPLLVSVVVRTYGWFVIIGPNGLYERALMALGFETPTRIFFTETAVLIGFIYLFLPYMVLGIASALDNIDQNLVLAARNLGSSDFQAFRKITLPLSLPGLVAGSLLVFAHASGSFVTPALLGGHSGIVLSQLAYQQVLSTFNWPLGSAISFILLAVIALTMVVYLQAARLISERRDVA